MPNVAPKTFVLVHGMWHGGWCWSRVADLLRMRGHRVTTPTQSGLGERAHLLSPAITLDTFIADIVRHLQCEELSDVVLVGHSFGGAPVSGTADRAREHIATLIFLDAGLLENGETRMSVGSAELAAERIKAAQEFSGGLSLPPPPAAAFGVSEPADIAWLARRLTPHPFATLTTPLQLDHPLGNGLPAHFIACTNPAYPPTAQGRERAQARGWPVWPLAAGHDAMVSHPLATADLLEKLAGEG